MCIISDIDLMKEKEITSDEILEETVKELRALVLVHL